MKRFLVLIPWFFVAEIQGTVWAQTVDTLKSVPNDFDDILEESVQEEEESPMVDVLDRLAERPLDLNSVSEVELQQIPGIDATLAARLVALRKVKIFETLIELRAVEGVSEDLFERIRRLVVVSGKALSKTDAALSVSFRTRASQDVQRRRGFVDGGYRGSAAKLYSRFLAEWTNESNGSLLQNGEIGMVAEKDPGERAIDGFVASFLTIGLKPVPVRILIGDFVVEMGQGLVLWRGSRLSKGGDVFVPAARSGLGVRPYRSTDEMSFLRGAAVTVDLGWVTPSVFYSNKPLSGSLSGEGEIASLYTAGLFRTEAERRRRNASRECLVGMTIRGEPVEGLRFDVGGFRSSYLHPIIEPGSSHSTYERGVAGVGVSWSRPRFSVFGEVAFRRATSGAMAGGAVLRPLRELALVVAARRYDQQFENSHASGFGESGNQKNESGFYIGANTSLTSWLTISAFYDLYHFPGKSSSSLFQSSGNESFVQWNLKLARHVKLIFQYREKKKPDFVETQDPFKRSGSSSGHRFQRRYRGTLEFIPPKILRWRTRIEIVNVSSRQSKPGERGMVIFQDLGIEAFHDLQLATRVVMFDTPSFDSRIYEFESDVRGAFSNVSLFGRGVRMYIVAHLNVAEGMRVGVKYGITAKEDTRRIGTGLDEIQGDQESRVTVQCDLRF